MKHKLIQLKSIDDERGNLIVFENGINSPFPVQRAFYIYDTKGSDTVRGAHANRKSQFLLVVINGSCRVRINDGKKQDEVLLNNPHFALYLDKMVWKEMFEFSHNAVLLVLSDQLYEESEYIRDYTSFVQEISNDTPTF